MKNLPRTLAVLILVGFVAQTALADEMTYVYQRIYTNATTLRQKEAAVTAITAQNDAETAPVLAFVLEDLVKTGVNVREGSPDREIWSHMLRVVIGNLGNFRHVESAPFVWDAEEQSKDPLVRAEALEALGNMRAVEYAEKISLILRNLNFSPAPDSEAGEKVAYGAILALEKLKDPVGFAPVFFASDGWYTKRVKDQALRSLPNIADDPTEPVRAILASEVPDRKIKALDLELGSKAPDAKKIEIARMALDQGHALSPRDRAEGTKLKDLRVGGIRGLITLKAGGGTSTARLRESYKLGDMDEQLLALQALGTDASDVSAQTLAEILLDLDSLQRSGVTDENRTRLALAAIQYAGATKNRVVRPSLTAISMNEKWSGSVIRAAQDTLKALP
jgi:hypothetical protein